MNEKKYEFRDLNATDIFPMVHIISQIGIKEFKECFSTPDVQNAISEMKNAKDKDEKEKAVKGIGISVVFDIVDLLTKNLSNCENDIFNLLSSVSGMKVNEVKSLSMAEFVGMLIDFVKKPEFTDFISVVSGFLK